jgi:hypothetical protein
MKRYAAALAVLIGSVAIYGGVAGAQQTGTIRITAPGDGATVSGPVMLSVDIQGVTVKPAAEGDPNAFHYHALVDVDPATVLQPGQPIPTGQANIIHTADPTLMLNDLAPGQHTVVVVLTRTDHVPLNPNVQDRVTFTVAAPGTGGAGAGAAQATPSPAAGQAGAGQTPVAVPRVGTGGALTADRGVGAMLALAAAAALALGTGGALVYVRRR